MTQLDERTQGGNRIKGLLATQGVALELQEDFPTQLRKVRLWDGSPLPPELRGRLEREWIRRQTVVEEMRALEAERKRRLRERTGDPILAQVRQLMKIKGIGLKSAMYPRKLWIEPRERGELTG